MSVSFLCVISITIVTMLLCHHGTCGRTTVIEFISKEMTNMARKTTQRRVIYSSLMQILLGRLKPSDAEPLNVMSCDGTSPAGAIHNV